METPFNNSQRFCVCSASARSFLFRTNTLGISVRPSSPIIRSTLSIWVSMFVFPDNPFMERLPDLLVRYGARPHWGKCVFHRPTDVAALFPRWDEFCAFRNELDPKGLFINRFAADFGIST